MLDMQKTDGREAFFLYSNAANEKSTHAVVRLVEKGNYIQGYSVTKRSYRTFRKDRIIRMFDSLDELNGFEIDSLPTDTSHNVKVKSSPLKSSNDKPLEICFTGFAKSEKDELTHLAKLANLDVKSGVSARLAFLCCGPNAGWRKIEDANNNGALILSAQQFKEFIETGEIPYKSKDLDGIVTTLTSLEEEKLRTLKDNAATTFSTIRSFQRSNVLIAQFVDGYAIGWKFAVKSVFREALDIKLTTSVFDNYKYETWTQGNRYAFHRGDTFYSDRLGYTDWPAFLKLDSAVVLKIKFECFAGYETIAELNGSFSGNFVPDNLIGSKELTDLPLLIESQTYDPGTLTIDVLRPVQDKTRVELTDTLTMDQDEFISLLQTGCYWKKEKGHPPKKMDLLNNGS